MAGSTVIVIMAASNASIPDGWARDAVNGFVANSFRRPQLDGGENSWAFTASGTINWAWYAEEIAGIDLVDAVDQTANGFSGANSTTVSAGTTGTTTSSDDLVQAVFAINSAGSGTFPAGRSYSGGFTEIAYVASGSGAANQDVAVSVAELYPGATGTQTCTLTYSTAGGGTVTNMSEFGLITAHRAPGSFSDGPAVLTPVIPP